MAIKVSVKEVRFYMRNVRTRMPFKYGQATLTSVPILHTLMDVELGDGTLSRGTAADILPPKWFDKDPAKDYERNVGDLIWGARAAAVAYGEAGQRSKSVFAIWRRGYADSLAAGEAQNLNHLTSAHGSSLMERALIDGVGRALGATYFEMLRENTLGVDFSLIHPELEGVMPIDVIAPAPLGRIHVRHTVGLADPIRTGDIARQERLDDGLPQSLEEYIDEQGISYFKIKVNGDLEGDLERLRRIAELLDRTEVPYRVSLDGNEQYREMETFLELMGRMQEERVLDRFYSSIIYIEQPLDRAAALDPALAAGIRSVSARKPMVIDESDEDLGVFKAAVDLGYLGVSSKNCKGVLKALTNQALARHLGEDYFLTGEDLMNLPIVALHQDLVHLAALGIPHAERNGHHYVRGLDHLSSSERRGCRLRHEGLYRQRGDSLVLDIRRGRIELGSLQLPGLGVGVAPDLDSMVPLEEWEFSSLE